MSKEKSYTPPADVAKAAKKGLKFRSVKPDGVAVGIRRRRIVSLGGVFI